MFAWLPILAYKAIHVTCSQVSGINLICSSNIFFFVLEVLFSFYGLHPVAIQCIRTRF